jgi:Fic family protein
MYLWQSPHWPELTHDAASVAPDVARARLAQGKLLGLAASLQLLELGELQLNSWALEAMATAQIEGETLPLHSVRASAARRLGLPDASLAERDPRTEATLDILQAAAKQWQQTLSTDHILAWHAALFPTGYSGITRIAAGQYRTHAEPMQIVTARLGKPDVVHYQAPPSSDVSAHMQALLLWFNSSHGQIDGLVRAALLHLHFEAIHPFEDGNGRVGRALAELALAQDMQTPQRLFSLSAQLWADRKGYYAQLQAATGQANADVTPWVRWFVGCVEQACLAALAHIQTALDKNRLWARLSTSHPQISASQRKALNKIIDGGPQGFTQGISTEKYANLTSVSRATAWRELTQLAEWGLLLKTGQGRGTRYVWEWGAGQGLRDVGQS